MENKEIVPFGSSILIEFLTSQEIAGTIIQISDKTDMGPPQAYIVSLGPKLPEDCGLKVGDRIIVQGQGFIVPSGPNGRKRSVIEIHQIKAIVD